MFNWLSHLPDWQLNILLGIEAVIVVGLLAWTIRKNILNAGFFHEEIACAAVKYPDIGVLFLPAPARHHHVMWTRLFIDGASSRNVVQGFLTTNGRFVDRVEGLRIATKRDQIIKKEGNPNELYSEDMWPTPAKAWGWTIHNVGERPE